MKKLITFVLLAGWVLTAYSQKVIELEETTLTFEPTGEVVFEDYANGIVKVRENYAAQFQSNAIAFINENFDINRFRKESGNLNGDIYVTVTSPKGHLNARYDDKNQLVSTFQKFEDVPLPFEVRNEVYANYMGWTLTKDKYIASGTEGNIDKEKYIVYLEKGSEREKLRITPARTSTTGVAMVEKF
ncbi:hypothetical protein GCM10023115_51640 [Pontixanthobacter gangjinensis]|uniref:Uncharacterized protein n=1 Tax=Christiangramia aestuarii TaxID=1028746 RepID=A0A7K1LPP0_9FLAO|nr:hypothetical protein [Christiangramia aestuarii]MUP42746.1 hypothetical protein [Christiangramia aestuarii]